jgi:hypothetical protein
VPGFILKHCSELLKHISVGADSGGGVADAADGRKLTCEGEAAGRLADVAAVDA